jgi:serine protease Do
LEKSRGALVSNVSEGGPAAQAGMKAGDVIVEYDGKPVDDSNQLPIMVARTEVGKNVKTTVIRDKQRVPITVKIGELKEQEVVASAQPGKLGLTLQNVTPEMAESLGLNRANGVVVTSVQPQSAAAEAGLRRGDVVLEVNRTSVANSDEFQKLTNQAEPGEHLLFLISRGGSNLFLALRSPGASQG